MILLKSINVHERLAELIQQDTDASQQEILIAPVLVAASTLGLQKLHLQDSLGAHEELLLQSKEEDGSFTDPSQSIVEAGSHPANAEPSWKNLESILYDHRWSVDNDCLVYDARFAHESAAPPLIAAYVSLLLATVGTRESKILQFRLAIYEICANIIEHGTLQGAPSEIGFHLALTQQEVRGWIQDACERFDLSVQPAGTIKERAETRASRGYGIHMMHQLLESIDHEFNSTGNRIHFSKRIAS